MGTMIEGDRGRRGRCDIDGDCDPIENVTGTCYRGGALKGIVMVMTERYDDE